MQDNNIDFDEDDENDKRMENDKDEDRKDLIPNKNIEYLNYINNLKSSEYENLISEMYEDVSLYQDNNDDKKSELKISICSQILKI